MNSSNWELRRAIEDVIRSNVNYGGSFQEYHLKFRKKFFSIFRGESSFKKSKMEFVDYVESIDRLKEYFEIVSGNSDIVIKRLNQERAEKANANRRLIEEKRIEEIKRRELEEEKAYFERRKRGEPMGIDDLIFELRQRDKEE
ncbi:hypothetical protein MKY95_19335 [Paenibacillus sp. FSL P4-0176]|uniref:hypothetical protein n=1 Tax=Paenibacillus sp. FSL P4-0176 TaxID=2921631 RepID=UPI0030CBC315